ncbi:helix-turn-helix domain-containing protein [Paenibacillus herberti]|uniref:AraC family transcriptional regulator n=1 Tax=Paenibacillus herberti TaxID=1619309 RepID=A0A229P5F0_9BACL|nr:AraC family transcriptional regulator [Paenibacillus herberti]OXM17281.1 AraC family transcriptional regulator [Paenibacillus herberti]
MFLPQPLPDFVDHTYWDQKKQFQLASDQYTNWVLFAVEKGSFRFKIGSLSGTAQFAEAVLCPPGMIFNREVLDPVSFHFLTFKNIQPPELPGAPALQSPLKLTFRDKQRLFNTLHQLHGCAAATAASEAGRAWAAHLLADLLQQYAWESSQPIQQQPGHDSSGEPLLRKARLRIEETACRELSLGELARELGLSPVQLTRRFKARYGLSPSALQQSIRLQKARSLLTETSLTLEKIAEECGYESGFYLSRLFKKQVGSSPSEYRSRFRI